MQFMLYNENNKFNKLNNEVNENSIRCYNFRAKISKKNKCIKIIYPYK